MTIYQIAVPAICAFILFYAIVRRHHHEISSRELIVWILVWGGVGFSALFPSKIITLLQKTTGITGGVNALLIPAVVTLIFIVFKLILRIDKIEQRQIKIIRAHTLQKFDDELKK